MVEHAVVGSAPDKVKVRRALLSVSDKSRLTEFATFLASQGVEILSTGGTAKALRSAGITVTDISSYTDFPEILNGRVKTLHPKVHGGLLAVRGNADHDAELARHEIVPIDMVVANLYPFASTVSSGKDFDLCIENIDIGGPSMIRSAAKNLRSVAVLTDPMQYGLVRDEMSRHEGAITFKTRKTLAASAFRLTSEYDSFIDAWFQKQIV